MHVHRPLIIAKPNNEGKPCARQYLKTQKKMHLGTLGPTGHMDKGGTEEREAWIGILTVP